MSVHPPLEAILEYQTGVLPEAECLSLEAHLLACPMCRESLANSTDAARLRLTWTQIVGRLDLRDQAMLERFLTGCGVRSDVARILTATPALRSRWLLAVAAVLGFAVAATHAGASTNVFLAVAPVIPVLSVALAFGPKVDPCFEVSLAAPIDGFRLVLMRTVAVTIPSFIVAGVAGLLLPQVDWVSSAWLLPALTLIVVGLALATAAPIHRAVTMVVVGWLAFVVATEMITETSLSILRGSALLPMTAIALLGAGVLILRRDQFEFWR